ncbi:bifunctional glycosyltransferase/CDP-glycerol:glycerophosphate glycerophosphotransferase [Specibacter sp. AOP5-B1-6]|uniref:bifunctional glycosyltransferase/CDP-glycerol:glycerophosphate glycerophosphotransferase n=1 Tax=Specibacter sp. AOP5-B1-6 TaxID=3457653 RepID=UPI00402B0825
MGLLSVVIPAYNVAEYIAECLTSVISQSYTNLEIIVVDDGSTDASMQIVAGFAKYDKRISVIQLENGGNGRARNIGINVAKGEYLTFADSDDVVAPGAYALMMTAIKTSGSDFVVGSSMRLIGKKLQSTKISSHMHAKERTGISINDFPDILDDVFLWNKVFKKSFWDAQVAPIPEGVLYEDQETTARAFVRARSFDVLEEIVYFWRQRSDGSSITQGKRAQKDIDDRMSVANRMTTLLVSESTPQVIEKWFVRLFGSDLVPYYGEVPYADDAYWSVLSVGVNSLCELMVENVSSMAKLSKRLDPHARVMLRLAASGMKDELERVIVDRMEVGTGYQLEVDDGRFYAIPNYWNLLPECSKATVLECDPALLQTDTHVSVRGWTSSGELKLSGYGFIRGLRDQELIGTTRVSVKTTGGPWTMLAVDPVVNENIDANTNDPFATHTNSAFTSAVPVSFLNSASSDILQVSIGLSVSGHEFEEQHTIVVPKNGTCGDLDVPRVCDFSVNLEAEKFYVSIDWGNGQPATQLYLATQTHRLNPISTRDLGGTVVRYEFTLAQPFWGREVYAPHSGAYTLRHRMDDNVSPTPIGKPMGASQALLWTMPLDYQLQHAHVRVRLNSGSFAIVFSAPLDEKERGRYWQRHQQEIFSRGEREIQNHLVFESFGGKSCTDSPRALSDAMHAQNADKEIYWSIQDFSVSYPSYAKPLIRGTRDWFEMVSGAHYLINNNNFPYYFRKAEGQFYLQTWHGTPMKKIGLDAPTRYLSPSYRRLMQREANYWDLLLAQNEYSRKILPKAFGYQGPVLTEGYPRNDVLSSHRAEQISLSTRKLLGIRDDQVAVLYAPTWRDSAKDMTGTHQWVGYVDFEDAKKVLDDSTVFLIRGHHNVSGSNAFLPRGNAIDVSEYPEINDLILASDALITDYSSIMFDYGVIDKPIFFLVTDLEDYQSDVRGLYVTHSQVGLGETFLDSQCVVESLSHLTRSSTRSMSSRQELWSRDDGGASKRVIDLFVME